MKKLFLCDIDGTILDGSRNMKHVSNKTKYAMEQLSKDNYVFIASGRCKGLLNEELLNLPINGMILCNGAYGEVKGKEVFADYLSQDTVEKIINCSNNCNGFYVLETLNHMYTNDLNSDKFIKFLIGWGQNIEIFKSLINLNDKYHVAMLGFVDEDSCIKAERELKGVATMLRHNGFKSYDVNIKGIDKGVAANRMMEYLGIDKQNTYCFGDGINDLEMLEAVGHPIIMANADKRLFKYNFERTLDVLDDGFYDYLLRNSLIKAI